MNFELSEAVFPDDLNRSFYFDEDLETDLKNADEFEVEDANFELKGLTLNDESEKQESFEKKSLSMTLPNIPTFETEKLLADAFERGILKKIKAHSKDYKKSGKVKKSKKVSFKIKPSDGFNCFSCCKTFSFRSSLTVHSKDPHCNNKITAKTLTSDTKHGKYRAKTLTKKYLCRPNMNRTI